jgi:tRNA (guanine-N7-)-methyltransferase
VLLATHERERLLSAVELPLDLDALVPAAAVAAGAAPGAAGAPWEVELGFGKGRYLLRRAAEEPRARFLGIEIAEEYFRLLVARARRRGVRNLLAIRGEAQTLLAAVLPRGFARAVHVYFPDPWPKARHERRRLFDAQSVDLVLSLLVPGGTLFFATDFLAYGEAVAALLAGHPAAVVRRRERGWDGGPRTNYEAKYTAEGRPIVRLEVTWAGGEGAAALHPAGRTGVLAGYRSAVTAARDEVAAGAVGASAAPSPGGGGG